MSTTTIALRTIDNSLTMIGRSVRHTTRNVEALLTSAILPVMLMLMFVYVFGGAIDPGHKYVDFVVPGIILLCAGSGAASTAVSVSTDMVNGVIDRFRSLPIRSSVVLTGHVVASVVKNLASMFIVVAVALLCGFRPHASPLEWLAATGMIVLFVVALSWAAVAVGLVAKSVEGANAFTFFALFLPYLSSAFVPTDTMPAALQAVADHQPMTPIIETVRGLLTGGAIGNNAWIAVAWFAPIALVCLALSVRVFNHR
jgi:ABC-2 type transport system permease protein